MTATRIKTIATFIGLALTGSGQVPFLAAYSAVLVPLGTAILGAVHFKRPGDVVPEAKP